LHHHRRGLRKACTPDHPLEHALRQLGASIDRRIAIEQEGGSGPGYLPGFRAAGNDTYRKQRRGCSPGWDDVPGGGMNSAIDHMRDELIKARILRHIARRHREGAIADMAKAEPEKSFPDVP
jgi:hypothetical protein